MVPRFQAKMQNLSPAQRDIIIIALALFAHSSYLLASIIVPGKIGFPLDDAWIHQTYARNLAESGTWSFIPGVPSTGSTSILWTLLITPGFLVGEGGLWWAHFMGLVSLCVTALGAVRLFDNMSPRLSLAVGAAVALEWHLVWAAASGMETIFFPALVIWMWVWFRRQRFEEGTHSLVNGILLGLWGGGLMFARPEGILAAAVAGTFALLAGSVPIKTRMVWASGAALGVLVSVLPFFGFNLLVSGEILPNTFFAKQTEYAVLWQTPYITRFLEQAFVSVTGAHILLLPGLVHGIIRRVRSGGRDAVGLAPLAWVVVHWALYAARLPVTYQHGRYAIPVIPLLVAFAVVETAALVRLRSSRLLVRAGSQVWVGSVVALFPLILFILGAPAYGRDVDFIEREMVAVAQWLDDNTSPTDIIAAHDIGALGYFAPRPLVDLAGLVSPDVIPFMDDPVRLAEHIQQRGASYLVVFPRWNDAYAQMIDSPVFSPIIDASYMSDNQIDSPLGPLTVYRVNYATQ